MLRAGGTVVHATETCYGLTCDLSNRYAVEKIFHIKQRTFDEPVSGLFASIEQAKDYVIWSERAEELARKYLPGPLTLILPIQRSKTSWIFPTPTGGTTLGVRVSSHPTAMALVEGFGKPLITTSANVHGGGNPYSAEDVVLGFTHGYTKPDILLDGGPLLPTPPSTIIDLSKPDAPNTLRQGGIAIE